MPDCEECYNDPNWVFWKDLPMNEEIKKKLSIQPPKQFYPSFDEAYFAWHGRYMEDE